MKEERRRAQLSSPEQQHVRQTEAALIEALLADRIRLTEQLEEMKREFQAQDSELEHARNELEQSKAELHRQTHLNASRDSELEHVHNELEQSQAELRRQILLNASRDPERELRCSHGACVLRADGSRGCEAKKPPAALPGLGCVAGAEGPERMAIREGRVADSDCREAAELRRELEDLQHKLEDEEAVNKLQNASFSSLYNRHTAFQAEVTHYLQELRQRHPDLACDFTSICGYAHASCQPLQINGA